MIKCKDCKAFSPQSEYGGVCNFTNFGTVKNDDGCPAGGIINDICNSCRRDAIKEFAEAYKNFMNEQGCSINSIHENCINGDCIDCFKDEWLKGQRMSIPSEQALWQMGKSADEWLEEHDKQIRADAIEEYRVALHKKYSDNKYLYESNGMGYWNLDMEEVDEIADRLKGAE